MRCLPLLVATIVLCGANARAADQYDQAGNRYPAWCADVSDIHVPVLPMTPAAMAAIAHNYNHRELGVWLAPGAPILIDETLRGWKRADAIRHELCHEKTYRLTGDARWHR